ncbi:MAG: hypothetical protein ACOVLE_04810 [Pirellula staleyi]
MNREEIQTLLSTSPSRPVSLVTVFVTITCLDAIFLSELLGVSSLGARWTNDLLLDFRYNLHIAVVFWLCFRGGKWFSIETIIPWLCLCGSLSLDSVFNRWSRTDPLYFVWVQVYRLLLIALVFRIFRRAFRISLVPNQCSARCPDLTLATLLFTMAIFACLILCDIQCRQRYVGQLFSNFVADPPFLAFLSALTRSTLWVGIALLLSKGKRNSVQIGLGLLALWFVSRSLVVIFLDGVLNPAVEKLAPFSRGRISMEELVFLQFLQLGVVWGVALFFVWTGYRFSFNKPVRNTMDNQAVKFDAIE